MSFDNNNTVVGHYADLAHKKFLVTGASSGIGRAIAIALSEQGASVLISGRNHERLQDTLAQMNNKACAIYADLTHATERQALIEQLPKLDGVCHAAGIISPFPIRYVDEAQFDKVFDINAKAPILLTAQLLKAKKINPHASLVFISSISAGRAMKGGSLYSASKAALEAFSKSITLEHAQAGIRANCIKPGMVKTPIYDMAKQYADNSGDDALYQQYKSLYPLGFGEPDSIAASAIFFLSAASAWISSSDLVMDGGYSARI